MAGWGAEAEGETPLAGSDLRIAIGAGSAVAVETADVILVRSNPQTDHNTKRTFQRPLSRHRNTEVGKTVNNKQERNSIMNTTTTEATDPICGMTVDTTTALHAERDEKTFYFCSEHCREKFLSAPTDSKPDDKSGGCCCG